MKFADRFNELMTQLNTNPTGLSEYCDIDRTSISRFRSGARTPKSSGKALPKLAKGIYVYADKQGLLPVLCDTIGCEHNASYNEIKQSIYEYLFDDISTDDSLDDVNVLYPHFARRLDYIMRLIPISNVELSNILHIDASLISRYRSGKRLPSNKGSSNIANHLVDSLYELVVKGDYTQTVAEHIGIDTCDFNVSSFGDWLLLDESANADVEFIRDLLMRYDSYDKQSGVILPSYEELFGNEKIDDGPSIYYGVKGLQEAVIRFLRRAVEADDKRTLLLYSDHDMSWITDNKSFQVRWAVLMNECVKKGIRIKIIHNINRSHDEMKKAIMSWLPLYLSGMVEAFCFKKQAILRFAHTLFLCPDYDAISAFTARGIDESELMFNYYTDARSLNSLKASYHKMMTDSISIVQSYTSYDFTEDDAVILDGNPFTNITIYIYSDHVFFYSKRNPKLIFRFSHPLLCKAFKEFALLF